jgi:outer membrane protein OmpA-like peptidoglycan-associated protein
MSRSIRLGVFIVTGLTILAVGSFLIGQRQFLFARTFQLKTTFVDVSGLSRGAQVRVGGIAKGIVDGIDLPRSPGGTMTVRMKIEKGARAVIRSDSKAAIQTEGLMGDQYVDVSFGTPDGGPIEEGATITGVPAVEMSDILRKTTELLESVQEGSAHLSSIAAKIDNGEGSLGALVNDRQVYASLKDTTDQARRGAVSLNENMQALKRSFFLKGFFRNRGYDDSTRLTEHAIDRLPTVSPGKQFQIDPTAVFGAPDTAKFRNEKALAEAGRFLEQHPFDLAVVAVGSSMKGDSKEMLVLTQARAMVIRDYLVANFRMADTRLKTIGLGKRADLPGDGRIDILIYPAGSR